MSDAPQAPLEFDRADEAPGAACSACQQPIASTYYTVGDQVMCERCKADVELALAQRPDFSNYARAVLLGSLWGLLGAAVWWGVRVFAHLEVGLIAIAIGYFVGKAVRSASGGLGGLRFQVLAVALTYFWISANYVPDIVQGVVAQVESEEPSGSEQATADATALAAAPALSSTAEAEPADDASSSVAALILLPIFVFGLAMAAPFLEGASNIIGLLIIAFGLYQAWTINKRAALSVAGPFSSSSRA